MAGHGQFQSAPKRLAVNSHHHRLAAILNVKQKRMQASAGSSRGHLAEFLDVRSRDKRAAGADHDRRLDGRVAVHLIDRRPDPLRHAGTESVHRWVVDGDDRYIVVFIFSDSHEVVHMASERSVTGTLWYFLRNSLFRTFPVAVFGKL